jgi:hypothetical protein
VLVLGDLNSYRMEDPVRAMRDRGLVDLLAQFSGGGQDEDYTYIYEGLAGTLDYAFASPELNPLVTGATVWHINADEAAVLEYSDAPGKLPEYHDHGPFRSSDHDPVIVGLMPGQAPASVSGETAAATQPSTAWDLALWGLLALALIFAGWNLHVPLKRPTIRVSGSAGSQQRRAEFAQLYLHPLGVAVTQAKQDFLAG